jgi:ATP-dependent DNA helicase RecQ
MHNEADSVAKDALDFASRCLSLDLEVGKTDAKIHQFGAVRLDSETAIPRALSFSHGPLAPALTRLDEFSDGTHFTLGHNVIIFDLPVLTAARPELLLLARPLDFIHLRLCLKRKPD